MLKNLGHIHDTDTLDSSVTFDDLYYMYYRQLHFYCNSIIANEDDAQDIVSDVFVIFYDRFKQFDNLKQIKSYLYTSVRNACINYIRHQKVVNEKSVDVDIFIISTRVKFSNFIVTLATATSPD